MVPWTVSRTPEAFHDLLAAERVTVLNQTPSAFQPLVLAQAKSASAARRTRYPATSAAALASERAINPPTGYFVSWNNKPARDWRADRPGDLGGVEPWNGFWIDATVSKNGAIAFTGTAPNQIEVRIRDTKKVTAAVEALAARRTGSGIHGVRLRAFSGRRGVIFGALRRRAIGEAQDGFAAAAPSPVRSCSSAVSSSANGPALASCSAAASPWPGSR